VPYPLGVTHPSNLQCLSRKYCWSAQQESFWATLKVEFYDRYLWPTKEAAKPAVGDWIERVYDRHRHHSAIAMMSPVDFAKTDSLR
jgi:Integrase core domain